MSSLKRPIHAASTKYEQVTIKSFGKRKAAITTASFIVLSIVVYFIYLKLFSTTKTEVILDKSIAVLPFADMSPNHDQEYFGDGIADEIINVLVQINDLKVIARTSSFQFKGRNESLSTIGEKLRVETILQGSVKKSNEHLRITAQLIKVSDGSHLWSKTFNRNSSDIFKVQDEIALAVLQALQITLSGTLPTSYVSSRNEEAYKLYQQGRYFYDRSGVDDLDIASDYFQKSLNIDSSQAIVWLYRGFHPTSKSFLSKAYKLDSMLPEVHVMKALEFMHKYNTTQAYKELSIALENGSANAFVLRNAGMRYAELGRFNDAIKFLKKAIDLDPLQTRGYEFLGQAYIFTRQYDSAIIAYRKVFEFSKDYQWNFSSLAYALFFAGRIEEAQKANKIDSAEPRRLYNSCIIEFSLGHRAKSDSAMRAFKLKYKNSAFEIATLHSYRNEKEDALLWLSKAFEQKSIGMYRLKTEVLLDPIRRDAKFVDLVKKMKFQ